MAYSSSLLLVLLFSVFWFSNTCSAATPFYPSGDDIVIRETCKNLVYHDLCVTSLKSDPESYTVSWDALPLISLRLSLKNITDTKGYIQQLLNAAGGGGGGGSITLKDSLKHCDGNYGFAIQSIKTSMEQYEIKRFRNVVKNINYARSNVTGCVKEIQKNPGLSRSLLSPKNTLAYQLLTVSYELGKSLVYIHDD